MDLNLKPKFLRIMTALWQGSVICIDDHDYAFCEHSDGTPGLVLATKVWINGEEEWLEAQHWTLNSFIAACEKLPEDEVLSICAGHVLRSLKSKNY